MNARAEHHGHAVKQNEVVVNGRFLAHPYGGVARVGCELLRALLIELADAEPRRTVRIAVPPNADVKWIGEVRADRCAAQSRGYSGRIGEQLILPLLHPGRTILNFCNVTPLLAAKSIVWIHDAHVFDAPHSYPIAYQLWHRSILAAVKLRRFRVVTVSSFARQRLIHHGVEPQLVDVVHNGGDHILRERLDNSVLESNGLEPGRYLLVVGSPARHKNVPFALDALIDHAGTDHKIAVVGLSQTGPYRHAGHLRSDPRIVILPRITDGQLRSLYASAAIVLAPSLVEGFGLYAVEAMFADSGPLVLSNRAALPEVGGDAALYFDPTDPRDLARAVRTALAPETAARLLAAARVQREKFLWRRSARLVIDRYLD